MKVIQREIYVAESGREFYNEDDCKAHELYWKFQEEFPWINLDEDEFRGLVEWLKENK